MQTSAHHHETRFNASSEASQKGANCHEGQIQAGTWFMEAQGIISKYDGRDISLE